MKRKCSVVIAAFNEESSLILLLNQLVEQLELLVKEKQITDYEILFVSDGSTDNSVPILKQEIKTRPYCKLIVLRRNCGKSYALAAGFRQVTGDIVFTLDADLQDDPADLPRFICKLDEGYDLVCGWKRHRQDPLEKILPSKLFNYVTSKIAGIRLHDFNCGFKAYKRKVIDTIAVYGEFHRYIPVLATRYGFKVTEIPITHHKRPFGKSKFGWERYLRGLFDAMSVWFLSKYALCPMYFFGKVALLLVATGGILCIYGVLSSAYIMAGLATLIGIVGAAIILSLGFIANLLLDHLQQVAPNGDCIEEIVEPPHEQ